MAKSVVLNYCPKVFTSLVSREILREALERWMTPLDAAESITGMAADKDSLARELSLAETASRTRFIKVRKVVRMCLFRSVFFAFCLILFSADL